MLYSLYQVLTLSLDHRACMFTKISLNLQRTAYRVTVATTLQLLDQRERVEITYRWRVSGLERTTRIRGVRCADRSVHRFGSTTLRRDQFSLQFESKIFTALKSAAESITQSVS